MIVRLWPPRCDAIGPFIASSLPRDTSSSRAVSQTLAYLYPLSGPLLQTSCPQAPCFKNKNDMKVNCQPSISPQNERRHGQQLEWAPHRPKVCSSARWGGIRNPRRPAACRRWPRARAPHWIADPAHTYTHGTGTQATRGAPYRATLSVASTPAPAQGGRGDDAERRRNDCPWPTPSAPPPLPKEPTAREGGI